MAKVNKNKKYSISNNNITSYKKEINPNKGGILSGFSQIFQSLSNKNSADSSGYRSVDSKTLAGKNILGTNRNSNPSSRYSKNKSNDKGSIISKLPVLNSFFKDSEGAKSSSKSKSKISSKNDSKDVDDTLAVKKIGQAAKPGMDRVFLANKKATKPAKSKTQKKFSWQQISLASATKNTFETSVLFWTQIKSGYKSLSFNFFKIFNSLFGYFSWIKLFQVLTIGSLIGIFCWHIFFDTTFVVKNYIVNYTKGSHLSKRDTEELLGAFNSRFLLLPYNSFWIASDQSLTAVAQSKNPDVLAVQIKNRIYPNTLELEVTTKPILATLKIWQNNKAEYWRINTDGKAITEDDAYIFENLIEVTYPATLDKRRMTFKDYPLFSSDLVQLNRLYFTLTMQNVLEELGFSPDRLLLPSLNSGDTVVEIWMDQTKLIFDAGRFEKMTQIQRLQIILDKKRTLRERLPEIRYIDFRFPSIVSYCDNSECVNTLE